jgi:hypothetical protein
MSTFEPMSEAELREIAGSCLNDKSRLSRATETALHHLARAKAAEEALDAERDDRRKIDRVRRDRDAAEAAAETLQAERDAAMEARDLAIAERDEAYRQRDVQASRVLGMGSMLDDARAILGARPDEMLSDAARRHARTDALVTEARKYLEPLVSDPSGDIEDLAKGAAKRIRYLNAAEVEPEADPNPPIPVHHTYAGDSDEVVIRITSRDPALLALRFGARLALVVTRG